MDHKEDGGPAFPTEGANYEYPYCTSGMTLRDYFAAKVLPVIVDNLPSGTSIGTSYPLANLGAARVAYAMADAMIKAREE